MIRRVPPNAAPSSECTSLPVHTCGIWVFFYTQSNGKLERWHHTLKVTTIRPNSPASLEEARRLVAAFVEYYNQRRLHSAIGFIAPADMLTDRGPAIWAARDQKLAAARARRRALWQSTPEKPPSQNPLEPTIVPHPNSYRSHHPKRRVLCIKQPIHESHSR